MELEPHSSGIMNTFVGHNFYTKQYQDTDVRFSSVRLLLSNQAFTNVSPPSVYDHISDLGDSSSKFGTSDVYHYGVKAASTSQRY
jgi:hypothetical protein